MSAPMVSLPYVGQLDRKALNGAFRERTPRNQHRLNRSISLSFPASVDQQHPHGLHSKKFDSFPLTRRGFQYSSSTSTPHDSHRAEGSHSRPASRTEFSNVYWREFPVPTGITDDDDIEEENPSEDTDGPSRSISGVHSSSRHHQRISVLTRDSRYKTDWLNRNRLNGISTPGKIYQKQALSLPIISDLSSSSQRNDTVCASSSSFLSSRRRFVCRGVIPADSPSPSAIFNDHHLPNDFEPSSFSDDTNGSRNLPRQQGNQNSSTPSPTGRQEPSSMDPTRHVIHLPPLPCRLWKYHKIFLLALFTSMLLGTLMHQSKIFRVRPSLSIEGFETYLPSPLKPTSSSVRSRRINLGALLAADLLLNGWGRSTSSFTREQMDIQTKSSTQMVPYHATDLIEVKSSSDSMCGVHQELINREFCPVGGSSALISTDWNASPLSCPVTYELSFSAENDRRLYHIQFAPLLLTWKKITPSSSVLIKQLQPQFTMAALQRDVYRLAMGHPKLTSLGEELQRLLSGFGTGTCRVHHSIGVNETMDGQSVVNLFRASGVQLLSVGTSRPMGFLDSAVCFAQSTPLRRVLRVPERLHMGPVGRDPDMNVKDDEADEAYENSTPARLLKQISVGWEVSSNPLGAVGRPFARHQPLNNDLQAITRQWSRVEGKGSHTLVSLFRWSKGFINPCYPFHRSMKFLLGSGAVYIVLFVCWLHSLASPNPVTLVHFPRLMIYQVIALYRAVILYFVGGLIERWVGAETDFSDHLVLYMMVGMILCTECTAAESSHHRILTGEETKTTDQIENHEEPQHTSTQMTKQLWKWPVPVRFVHWYTFVFCGFLCYSTFFTTLFFHHPYESLLGFLFGLLGLYTPLWILLSAGCLSLERFGILQGQ